MSDIDQSEVRDYQNESAGDAEMDAAIAERRATPCDAADTEYPAHVCGKVYGHSGGHGIWEPSWLFRIYQTSEGFSLSLGFYGTEAAALEALNNFRKSDLTNLWLAGPARSNRRRPYRLYQKIEGVQGRRYRFLGGYYSPEHAKFDRDFLASRGMTGLFFAGKPIDGEDMDAHL